MPQTFLAATFASPTVTFGASAITTPVVSVSTANNTITINQNNGRLDYSEKAVVTSTGAVPAPLVSGQAYWLVDVSGGVTFKLSHEKGGAAIDLTSAGSGSISVGLSLTDLDAQPITARGLDSGMPTWAGMHVASGVFSWTVMDAYMDYHVRQRGRPVFTCLNQTPSWAARNQALDAYGYAGGGQVPTSLNVITPFITALLQRYNAVSSFNPSGEKMLMAIEVWNEPQFAATGTVGTNWCGTMGELAQFARLVNLAAKAVDPSVLILAPGFTSGHTHIAPGGTGASLHNWLLASDGNGGAARQWIEGVCYHGYDTSDTDLPILSAKIERLRGIVQSAGLSAGFPLYQTERGVGSENHPLHFIRVALIEAAMGVRMSVLYKWDSYGHNPRASSLLAAAMNAVYQRVCGKTITYCAINQDGTVTVSGPDIPALTI